jgi:hypothetical protein
MDDIKVERILRGRGLMRCYCLMLTFTFLFSAIAAVADSVVPKPVQRARWSEDWSVQHDLAPLRHEQGQVAKDSWQPFKYIPLNERGDSYLSFGGEYRLAYELYDEVDIGISAIGRQDALQHRLALHGDWHLNSRWRLFGQLGYASVNDREGGPKTIDETDLDAWQLFIDHRVDLEDNGRLVFRLGRQLIETANVFITAGEAHNIRLVYDGGRVAWLDNDFIPFEAFAAEYVDYADGTFDMSGTDEYFQGLRIGMRHKETELATHLLYLRWDLKDRQFEQGGAGQHDEVRHTVMLWLNRPLSDSRRWGLDYYFAYQFGEYQDQPGDSDIRAFAAFGEFKYALSAEADRLVLGLKTSYFSGDSDSSDDELNTFYDHVFGTPYFSYARDIMPFNLVHVQPNISYDFGLYWRVTLSHDFLRRAERNDAYYNSANGILVRAGSSDSRDLGQQTQLAFHFRPYDGLIVNGYWSYLFAGEMLNDAGGSDRNYFHLGINFLF